MRAPHDGQCDGGRTTDSFRGRRQMHTFRKLAVQHPSRKEKTEKTVKKYSFRSFKKLYFLIIQMIQNGKMHMYMEIVETYHGEN